MMFEEANPPQEAAKRLEVGQRVELGATIGNRVIILVVTEIQDDGTYRGDQVAADPLDHRPFNDESRLKNQHFSWHHVLRVLPLRK